MDNTLPTDSGDRKAHPMATGLLDYFTAALAEVARVSKVGNDQHNPGQEMHWARGKSSDHADCLLRHLAERGTDDKDGLPHSAKVAWRALALLQEELEAQRGLPAPRAARDPVSDNPFVNFMAERKARMEETYEDKQADADDPNRPYTLNVWPDASFDGPNTVRVMYDQFMEAFGIPVIPLHDAGDKTGVMLGGSSPGFENFVSGLSAMTASEAPDGTMVPMATIRKAREDGVRRAYIAGPMRGFPKYNFPAFLDADEQVRRRGFETLNPAVIEIEQGLDPINRPEEAEERVSQFTSEDWMEVILRDLGCILTLDPKTDALFVLPGWERSTGAVAEVMLARWMGVQVRDVLTMDTLGSVGFVALYESLADWLHVNRNIV